MSFVEWKFIYWKKFKILCCDNSLIAMMAAIQAVGPGSILDVSFFYLFSLLML